ncbi:MAG: TIGR04013 family B12-binding domain/radical SAM domain-containing protein [Endomicrobiia bacterium]
MKTLALIFYYTKQNRYSFNSLLGSLQTKQELLEKIDVYLSFSKEDLLKTLKQTIDKKYKKIILGISFTTTQYKTVSEIVKEIKVLSGNDKRLILICGGSHTTGSPLSSLNLGFDLCFLGESEENFISFLEKILNDENYFEIPSIAFFDKDKSLKINKKNKDFVDLDKYPPISTYFDRYGPIEITRGCPYGCFFCQTSQIFTTKLRHRSVEKICEFVELMAKRKLYDTRFITPSLFLYGSENEKRLNLEIVEELFKNVSKIIKPKGKLFIGTFPSEIRPEHINNDTLYLLNKYADNDNVIIGVQSGSDRILELCHRKHTISDVYKAVELLSKTRFKVNLDFIFGLPYEEEKDVKQNIKVIDELTTKYKVKIHAHIFIPLVGTRFQNYKPQNLEFYLKYFDILKNKALIYGNWKKQIDYVENIN